MRAVTCTPFMRPSMWINSSQMPSARYVSSAGPPRFSKGSTAMVESADAMVERPAGPSGRPTFAASDRAFMNSAAVANRSAGFLASARSMTATIGSLSPGRFRTIGGDGILCVLPDDDGWRPQKRRVARKHFVQHAAKRVEIGATVERGVTKRLFWRHVLRVPTIVPIIVSGRTPTVVSAPVSTAAADDRATPKSATSGMPSDNRMFDGFTSRCTSPLACACPRALATPSAMRMASSTGNWPSRLTRASSEGPGM